MDNKAVRYESLIDLLEFNRKPDKGVIFINSKEEDTFISYDEIYKAAGSMLWSMQAIGMKPGQELIFQIADNEAFIYTFWACILGGIIPVPVTPGANEEHRSKLCKILSIMNDPYLITGEKEYGRLEDYFRQNSTLEEYEKIKSRTIFTEAVSRKSGTGRIHRAGRYDTAFIQFSSGSSGDPKGVVLTHENLLTNLNAIIISAGVGAEDSSLGWMPLTHDLGLIGFHLAPLFAGINQYIMSTASFITHPLKWMEKAHQYRISLSASPNFGYKHFLSFYKEDINRAWELSCIRLIINGAEPISASLSNEFYSKLAAYGLKKGAAFPVYGMAEACVAVSFSRPGDGLIPVSLNRSRLKTGNPVKMLESTDAGDAVVFVDLGYPVEDCFIRICDDKDELLDENVIGNIQIKGKNVTSGYYNNPEATKAAITSEGWLRTGDLGFLRNGRLVMTGRKKDIIFINGQNYYPHDIERAAEAAEGVTAGTVAVCGVYDEALQKERIAVFVLFKKSLEAFPALAVKIKIRIGRQTGLEADIIIPVRRLPKTTSGKLQRYKLKESYEAGEFTDVLQSLKLLIDEQPEDKLKEGPRNEADKKLLDVWAQVLGKANIGISDSYFETGGDSLKAAYIVSNIYEVFGVKLSIKDIFEAPTIKALSDYLENADKAIFEAIGKVETSGYYEVSSAQKRLFALSRMDGNATGYNISQAVWIKGEIDRERFSSACIELVRRNESLRTYFELHNGLPVQKIWQDPAFNIVFLDSEESRLSEVIAAFIKPFALEEPPLFRMCLVKITGDKHLLVLDMHHIIADGTSIGILLKQLILLYDGKKPAEPEITYKDFSAWQNAWLRKGMKESEEYWLNKFSGEIPVLDLPVDYQRPSYQSFDGDKLYFELDAATSSGLKLLAVKNGASLFMLLIAAYYVLLKKYSNQEDIVVGTSIAGRNHPQLKDMVGMLVNTLPLRGFPEGRKRFCDFLKEVKVMTLEAYENQNYQFELLVEKLNVTRDMSRNPLFDTMFVMQNIDMDGFSGDCLRLEKFPVNNRTAKFDLTFFVWEENNKLILEIEYCTRIFMKKTVERLAKHYCNILSEVLADPELKLSEIRMLSEEEAEKQVYGYNATGFDLPMDKTVIGIFEEQAERTPDNTAVYCNGKRLSYKQLDKLVNKLTGLLITGGLGRNDTAAIVAGRSAEMVAALLAVMKAGAAYVPIDPCYPAERINYMLRDSGAKLLLTEKQYREQLAFENEWIDIGDDSIYEGEAVSCQDLSSLEEPAYVIYTSGSTGAPKGVMLQHRNLVNYVLWASRKYLKGERLDFPLYTTISFDLTITSIFIPLITGNSIVIYDDDTDEVLIQKVIRDKRAGIVKATPSHLKLLQGEDHRASIVKRLIVGGEQLDTGLARAIEQSFGSHIEIYNEYGPTETTVGCMIHKFDSRKDLGINVPIGVPAGNVQIYLLDRDMNPVPVNAAGEIYISGEGVSKGYLGRKELTESKFVDNPFIKGKKMYKTGDKAKRQDCGNVEFIGRIDEQVKIRGYRIELGEIENRLLKHELIEQAAVVDRNNNDGSKYLAAYFKTRGEISSSEIRSFLMKELPEYMIPSCFVRLEEIPLTINGKVDRKALPEPDAQALSGKAYIAPENQKEEILAGIWAEVLGVSKVGVVDNYFELGGDSIKAIQIASKFNQAGFHISVRNILTLQTVRQCCMSCKEIINARKYSQKPVEGTIGLTPILQWFTGLELKNPNHYNQSILLKFKEEIDIKKLNRVITAIVEHHDGLRSNLDKSREKLNISNTHVIEGLGIELHDISGLSPVEQLSELERICESCKASFDIEKSLLFKCIAINCGKNGQYVFLTAHHIVVDGVSWRIILEDLYKGYMALNNDKAVIMPDKTASMLDWYEHYKVYMKNHSYRNNEGCWDEYRAGKYMLPLDMETDEWSNKNKGSISFKLGKDYTRKLISECHRAYNTDVKDLLLTALVGSLREWTGKDEFVIELESHGRDFEDLDMSRTVGWFTIIYPVKLKMSAEKEGEQIKAIKEQLRSIPDNRIDYSFLKYMEEYKALRNNSRTQIRFNYLGHFDNEAENELFSYSVIKTGSDTGLENEITAVLDINCMIVKQRLVVEAGYNNKAMTEARINSFVSDYIRRLELIVDHASQMEEIHFTPSDFDTVDLKQEDLDILFE